MPDAPPLPYPYLEEVLPGFHRGRAVVKEAGDAMGLLGFIGVKQEFYRFANRLRLAACFGGLHLKGFTDDTATGYDALTQVFFTWSAFERYADLANARPPFRELFAHHPRQRVHELATLCRAQDPEHKLVGFLITQALLPVHEMYLARYRDGHDFSVLTLAACIRHIFAHGHLTANPYRLPSANLVVICCALNDFLLDFIRSDFLRRVQWAEAVQKTKPG
ncbi:hypothetical protein EI77_03333 [Prosthecobacter fusiformis]|uniref:Uncharacterized protein n=1 Tax=Prosthecobacter fusiformis TaxID=48464 RepID=A0A4R7RNY5_9BACT|nr:hypothetical protein [Prosthecobacter fusiformis]TDU67132.1 hypothetical protein EI77_03333 [Prosthecobacter fusiformis]